MPWEVRFDDAFEAEFDQLPEAVQDELLAREGPGAVRSSAGPAARGHVEGLKARKHEGASV